MREITAAFFAKEDRGATVRRLDKRDQVAKQSAARQSRRLVRLCAPNQRQDCNARLDCQVEVATPFVNARVPHHFPLFAKARSQDCSDRIRNLELVSAPFRSVRSRRSTLLFPPSRFRGCCAPSGNLDSSPRPRGNMFPRRGTCGSAPRSYSPRIEATPRQQGKRLTEDLLVAAPRPILLQLRREQ